MLSSCLAAQSQLDISKCFDQLLGQRQGSKSYGKLQLAFLSRINEENYAQRARDANLMFPGIASGDYRAFNEQRKLHFDRWQLEASYYQSVALSSTVLASEDKSIIQACIDSTASSQLGFHYLVSAEDRTSASLRFFWQPLTEKSTMRVTGSILENAEVVGIKVKKGKLFPPRARVSGSGPTIILRRIDPAKPIIATVKTKAPIGTIGPIVIPPLSQEPTIETRYREQTLTESFIESRISRSSVPRGEGHEFKAIKEVDGIVLGIKCSWPPAINRHPLENCGPVRPQSNRAVCEGWTSDVTPYALNMTVTYSEPYTICTENCGDAWKKSNEQQMQTDSAFDVFKKTGSFPQLPTLPVALSRSANQEACRWQNGTSMYLHLK